MIYLGEHTYPSTNQPEGEASHVAVVAQDKEQRIKAAFKVEKQMGEVATSDVKPE